MLFATTNCRVFLGKGSKSHFTTLTLSLLILLDACRTTWNWPLSMFKGHGHFAADFVETPFHRQYFYCILQWNLSFDLIMPFITKDSSPLMNLLMKLMLLHRASTELHHVETLKLELAESSPLQGIPLAIQRGWTVSGSFVFPILMPFISEFNNLSFKANCEKAELGIYDGYEHSLESGEALKRYCGDLRYYKGEDERVMLSSRNRLLIRFQTREPSKPVVTSGSSVDLNVGFRLIWSDVEFNTPENCSKQSRFACTEARFCFTKNHIGGTSNCPDIRHYCISSDLVCDNLAHCSEQDASDEQNCYREGTVLFLILAPLGLLLLSLFLCFLCCKRAAVLQIPQKNGQQNVVKADQGPPNCWSKGSGPESNKSTHGHAFLGNMDLAPIPRLPITLGPHPECSPGASEIVSPASGFSDTESDSGSGQFLQHLAYCPAHGPVGPLRHFPLPYPLLPVLQEGSGYGSETYDEGGSTISSQNSEDLLNVSVLYEKDFDEPSSKAIQTWRLHQLRRSIRRSDAVCMSDDGKSSGASSPSRICPRCLEKEGRIVSTQSSLTSAGVQFDSGVDSLKNVSFDTATSSDLSMSRHTGYLGHFNNASIQTDDLGDSSTTTNDSFCTTVTTFGVKDAGREVQKTAKATDV